MTTNNNLVVESLTTDEVLEQIHNRIIDGWVYIIGDTDLIEALENAAYPPGTPENANLELFCAPAGLIFIGKQTEMLTAAIVDGHRGSRFTNLSLSGMVVLAPVHVTPSGQIAAHVARCAADARRDVADDVTTWIYKRYFAGNVHGIATADNYMGIQS